MLRFIGIATILYSSQLLAGSISMPSGVPVPIIKSDGKVCDKGFYRTGSSDCLKVMIPRNGELNKLGSWWTCKRGYYLSKGSCLKFIIPENAYMHEEINNWYCNPGFTRVYRGCVKTPVCSNEFFIKNGRCVKIPEGAKLDSTGWGWWCKKGYYYYSSPKAGCRKIPDPNDPKRDPGRFLTFARDGKIAELRAMFARGADKNPLVKKEFPAAMIRAISYNQIEVVQLLIERGADVNAPKGSNRAPLTSAAQSGNEEIVRLLVAHGADIDYGPNINKSSALKLVASFVPRNPRRASMVKLLLELGANPNPEDSAGRTPLHWVAQDADVEVLKVLLSHPKIKLSKLDNNGYTPLYYARRSMARAKTPEDSRLTIELLEQAGAMEWAMNPVRVLYELKRGFSGIFVSH